jgi:NAD(P)H dehydrogenase (quinone)
MILVTGATGHVGRAVVSRLVSSGHEVAALIRRPQAAQRRLALGTALRIGDYDDASALKTAFTGIDELVLISSDGDADAVMRHHANAIEAAAAAGVRHITFTSIVDIDEASPFYYAPAYRDAERRLVSCGVPSTILRCGLYSDFILDTWLAPATGELALPAGQGLMAPVSREDVAAAVAAAAARAGTSRTLYTITGNRALGFDEIAACYGDVTARPLRYRPCSLGEYLASARLDAPWPQAFSSLCTSISEGRYAATSSDFTALTGRQPASFRDFLMRVASGMPADS